jgi:hypothetical protein
MRCAFMAENSRKRAAAKPKDQRKKSKASEVADKSTVSGPTRRKGKPDDAAARKTEGTEELAALRAACHGRTPNRTVALATA